MNLHQGHHSPCYQGSLPVREVADAALDGVGGVGVLRDHGEELGGDMVVEPGNDGAVVLHPIVVALSRSVVDVITEPVLTEDGGEGASPGDVVRVIEIEDDRHAVQDVDAVDDRRGSGLGLDTERVWEQRLGVGVVVGARRGSGRRAHGGGERKAES